MIGLIFLDFALMMVAGMISFSYAKTSNSFQNNSFDNGSLRNFSNDNGPYVIISCYFGSEAPNCHHTIDTLSTGINTYGTIIIFDGFDAYDTQGNTSHSIIGNLVDTTSVLVRI